MVLVIMGVCGSGKSTVGILLAEKLKCTFFDADDFHPQANVDKMSRGEPLNDDDRKPWLERLNEVMRENRVKEEHTIVGCSALKGFYREILSDGIDDMRFVYLRGDFELIYERMSSREGHFMGENMVQSQFDALEEPGDDAIVVDIKHSPEELVAQIEAQLG